MQNPDTGELTAIAEETLSEMPENWAIYQVGDLVQFQGWWWQIVATTYGQLTIRPVKEASEGG